MKFSALLDRKTLTSGTTRTPPPHHTALSFKSVCLHDWWLIKPPDGKEGLAAAGFSSREGMTDRAFRSATISKRLDATTLETVDGFTISLVGFINKDLTQQNGFSSEVCSQFQFGFSYDWEEYAVKGRVLSPKKSLAESTIVTRSSKKRKDPLPEDLHLTGDHDSLACSHKNSVFDKLTKKAIEDLFGCIRDFEQNESLSPSKDNNVNIGEGVMMEPDRSSLTNSFSHFLREGCGLAKKFFINSGPQENGFQVESFNDPPGSRKPGKSDHITVPAKRRKSLGTKEAEDSFCPEKIISDSVTTAMSVEKSSIQEGCGLANTGALENSSQVESFNDPPGPTKPGKSNHIIPAKRKKSSDTKEAEDSFCPERINSDSVSTTMLVEKSSIQEGCGLAKKFCALENSSRVESFNDPSGSRKPGKSDHIISVKRRKSRDTKEAEDAFRPERIDSDSVSTSMPIESLTSREAGGTPKDFKKKHVRSRRITRSMTKEKSGPQTRKSTH